MRRFRRLQINPDNTYDTLEAPREVVGDGSCWLTGTFVDMWDRITDAMFGLFISTEERGGMTMRKTLRMIDANT